MRNRRSLDLTLVISVVLALALMLGSGALPARAAGSAHVQAAPPDGAPGDVGTPPTALRPGGLPWAEPGEPAPSAEAGLGPAEGTTDLNFDNPRIGGEVHDVLVEDDGQVLVGGRIDTVRGAARGLLVRLNPDGSVDAGFNPQVAGSSVNDIAEDARGRFLIAGGFSTVGGVARNRVARLNPDGSLDQTFASPALNGEVNAIAVQADGRILIAGAFTGFGADPHRGVLRMNGDGSLDTSFVDPDVRSYGSAGATVEAMALEPDGSVLIGGSFRYVAGVPHGLVARLHADGSVDAAYIPQLSGTQVLALTPAPGGGVLVGGAITAVNGQSRTGLARLDASGALDTTFDAGVGATSDAEPVKAITVQPDGRILIGGSFAEVGGEARTRLARLESNGQLDPTLADPLIEGDVRSIGLRADGGILAGGDVRRAEGYAYAGLALLFAVSTSRSGELDHTFGLNAVWNLTEIPSIANDVTIEPDGSIVTAGSTDKFGGRMLVTRTDALGTPERGFGQYGAIRLNLTPGDDWAEAVLIQPNGKIVLAGHIGNGSEAMAVVRLRADGTKDPTFSGDGVATVDLGSGLDVAVDVARLPDGDLVVAGLATGASRHIGVARLNGDGTLDRSFSGDGRVVTDLSGPGEFAYGVAAQADGRIVVAGIKSPGRAVVLRYRANGRLDPSFSGDGIKPIAFTTNASAATGIAVADDGDLVVSATDGTGGGRFAVARLDSSGQFDGTFADDGTLLVDAGPGFDEAWDLALSPDGSILLGGDTLNAGAFAVVRVLGNGKLDASFSGDGVASYDLRIGGERAIGLAVQPDGGAVLAGFEYASTPHVLVARAWG